MVEDSVIEERMIRLYGNNRFLHLFVGDGPTLAMLNTGNVSLCLSFLPYVRPSLSKLRLGSERPKPDHEGPKSDPKSLEQSQARLRVAYVGL